MEALGTFLAPLSFALQNMAKLLSSSMGLVFVCSMQSLRCILWMKKMLNDFLVGIWKWIVDVIKA